MSDQLLAEVREALDKWQADYDEGWGDVFRSGHFEEGGFALMAHGEPHLDNVFRLLRTARAWLDSEPT